MLTLVLTTSSQSLPSLRGKQEISQDHPNRVMALSIEVTFYGANSIPTDMHSLVLNRTRVGDKQEERFQPLDRSRSAPFARPNLRKLRFIAVSSLAVGGTLHNNSTRLYDCYTTCGG